MGVTLRVQACHAKPTKVSCYAYKDVVVNVLGYHAMLTMLC